MAQICLHRQFFFNLSKISCSVRLVCEVRLPQYFDFQESNSDSHEGGVRRCKLFRDNDIAANLQKSMRVSCQGCVSREPPLEFVAEMMDEAQ